MQGPILKQDHRFLGRHRPDPENSSRRTDSGHRRLTPHLWELRVPPWGSRLCPQGGTPWPLWVRGPGWVTASQDALRGDGPLPSQARDRLPGGNTSRPAAVFPFCLPALIFPGVARGVSTMSDTGLVGALEPGQWGRGTGEGGAGLNSMSSTAARGRGAERSPKVTTSHREPPPPTRTPRAPGTRLSQCPAPGVAGHQAQWPGLCGGFLCRQSDRISLLSLIHI